MQQLGAVEEEVLDRIEDGLEALLRELRQLAEDLK